MGHDESLERISDGILSLSLSLAVREEDEPLINLLTHTLTDPPPSPLLLIFSSLFFFERYVDDQNAEEEGMMMAGEILPGQGMMGRDDEENGGDAMDIDPVEEERIEFVEGVGEEDEARNEDGEMGQFIPSDSRIRELKERFPSLHPPATFLIVLLIFPPPLPHLVSHYQSTAPSTVWIFIF